MALRYAILGYLSSGPGSGYDLVQQMDGDLGWFWAASHSQIYPELRNLETAGLIEGTATTVGERLEKRVYSLTEEGARQLQAWTEKTPQYRPNRDAERLQLIFADGNGVESIRAHLETHLDHFTRRRAQLIGMRDRILNREHPRVEQRLALKDAQGRELSLFLRDIAYGGDLRRAEGEIAWAKESLARLDEL
ncbi:PadR family transcriptional regulator [Microbacterium sp. CPCC 204701]|uniref:PadR family transcriptional regulator n=1 Tax=Microbacterium sp. CPCC 204701 TaxID=2493084 RepID=UPI000FD8B535|nr:PadR family transcriptional regulator [Microbacterium sp. CPCC 204701]